MATCGWTLNCFAFTQDAFSHLLPNWHVALEHNVVAPFVARLSKARSWD